MISPLVVLQAALAGMRGDSPMNGIKNVMSAIGDQLFGENLMFAVAAQVKANEKANGTQIVSSEDEWPTVIGKYGSFILNESFLPLAVSEFARFKQSWNEPVILPSGRKVVSSDLFLANFGGIRISRFNLNASITAEAKALSASSGRNNFEYSRNYKQATTDSEKTALFNEVSARDAKNFSETKSLFADAKVLGLTDDKLATLAKDSGMPARISLGAIDGIYTPPKQEKDKSPTDIVNEMVGTGASQSEVLAEIKAIAGKDRYQANSLMNSYRSMVNDQRLRITGQDKLLVSLGEGNQDRANYISKRYNQIANSIGQSMADAYVLELRHKRIITPAVNSQLKSLGVNVGN
jgi:hypothetical protein